jgi:predicted methyltransferase
MDMSAYQTIRDILKSSGIITIRGNWVTLTEKGIQFAADINATLKQNKEATK